MVNSRSNGETTGDGQRAKRNRDESPAASKQHNAKRSRVSRACDQCRASRERCDGVQPVCQTCRGQDRSCSYDEQPKKRGIQPNYIRTLELTIAWLFRAHPGTESALADALPDEGSDARALVGSRDVEVSDELHQAWRTSIVNRQIEQILSGMTVEKRTPTTDLTNPDFLDSNFRPKAATNLYNSPPASAGSEPVVALQNATVPAPPFKSSVDEQCYRLPSNAWTLLEYYFAFTHSWIPMTGKHNLMKIMYSYPPNGLTFEQVNSAEHAELWAIMALTSFQVLGDQVDHSAQTIGRLADSLLPPNGSSYEVPHIRALMLRALDDMQREQIMAAWLRIGTVARLLHLFKLLANLGNTARWCQHVHLAAFIIEGELAKRLNTNGHFRTDYVKNVGFVDEDGLDEWAPWIDPLHQNEILPVSRAPAPAKAFSNLNELARMYMRLADSTSAESALASPGADNGGSIVSLLLQNSSARDRRVQPWQLIIAFCGKSTPKASNLEGGDSSQPNRDWMTITDIGTGPAQTDASSIQSHSHPFMTMPNDGDQIDTTPARSDVLALWPPDVQMHDPTLAVDPMMEMDNTDIFDELASLERQDSMHRPQFMQNLGFPDLDLAEFFGTDYQVSDPLLSYLQPDRLGGSVQREGSTSYG